MSEILEDLNQELERNFLRRIHMTCDDERFHDVWLIYTNNTERIPSVKYLLTLQSEYFEAEFRWRRENANNQDLHLPEFETIPLDIFKVLHSSVFVPGEFNVNDRTLMDKFRLLCLSNYYRFEDVEEVMNKYFINIMTQENCWELLDLSATYAQSHLGNACGHFISQKINNLESNNNFLELDKDSLAFLLGRDTFHLQEERIFQIALAWNEKNPNEDITLIKNSIRIQLAMDEDVRQQMINWCGRNANEYDRRPRIQQPNIKIANLDYFA